VQTRRLAASFDTFTGSVEHTRPEKFPRHVRLGIFFENPRKQPNTRVKIIYLKVRYRRKSVMKSRSILKPRYIQFRIISDHVISGLQGIFHVSY